ELVFGGAADKRAKIRGRAERGMDRRVPTLLRADRPRASDVFRAGYQRVVGPLAPFAADGVDGWEVKDIETHCRDIRQNGLAILERSMRAGDRADGAREKLVPAAAARALAVDPHEELD